MALSRGQGFCLLALFLLGIFAIALPSQSHIHNDVQSASPRAVAHPGNLSLAPSTEPTFMHLNVSAMQGKFVSPSNASEGGNYGDEQDHIVSQVSSMGSETTSIAHVEPTSTSTQVDISMVAAEFASPLKVSERSQDEKNEDIMALQISSTSFGASPIQTISASDLTVISEKAVETIIYAKSNDVEDKSAPRRQAIRSPSVSRNTSVNHNSITKRDISDIYINLVNATPYRWRKGYVHSYQMRGWDTWPDFIEPGEVATIFAALDAMWSAKDSAAEVAYHLEGTSEPMSLMVEYHKGNEHNVWIRFLEELSTFGNSKGSSINLGKEFSPGGLGFVIAGMEGDFISNGGPQAWMQAQLPHIGHLPLREIIMPRSHHAGLWKSVKKVGLGSSGNSQTQVVDLYQQISHGGVRVLDVRPAKKDGTWREAHINSGSWSHGMLGATIQEMINMTNKFNAEHPGELFIWDIHEGLNADDINGNWKLVELEDWWRRDIFELLKHLEHRIAVPDDEDLTKWPLNRFIGDGQSAVLIRFPKEWDTEDFPGGKEGFITSTSFPVNQRWSNKRKTSAMVEDQLKYIHDERPNRKAKVFHSDWLVSQKGLDVVFEDLIEMSRESWRALFDELWGGVTDESYPNWIAMDAIDGPRLKSIVMAMNHCLAARRCGKLGGKAKGAD